MSDGFVNAAARRPFGPFVGALALARPDDLAASVVTGAVAQAPDLDPAVIGGVVWVCANQVGEGHRNVGRMAVVPENVA